MSSLRNPIQYTSRTFNTILNDINNDSDLVDKPDWFKRCIAGLGDVFSLMLNAQANNSFLGTAFTRSVVIEAARMIDYEASPQTTSSGTQLFYLNSSVSYPLSIALADLVAFTQGSLSVSAKRFEARASFSLASAVSETFTANAGNDQLTVARVYTTGEKVRVSTSGTLPSPLAINTDYYVIYVDDTHIRLSTTLSNAYAGTYIDITTTGSGTHTIELFSIQVEVYQQELQSQKNIGTSDGTTIWQEFNLPDIDILEDTLVITINSVTWTKVDTFIDSGAADTHFQLLYNTDNSSFIRFGNGTYGAIPGNFSIYADYAIGGGENSNVSTIDHINIYGGSDTNIEGTSNPAAFTGGDSPEEITEIQRNAPLLLKSRDRAITSSDFIALSLNYGGLSKVTVNKNKYGVLSVQVLGIANGGGNPSASVKSALQTYLINRTVLESIDVRVEDTTFNVQAVTSQIKILSGYTFSDVQAYTVLAYRLFFTEAGDEIVQKLLDDGIASTVTFINNKWSTSFGVNDYDQIIRLIENLDTREWGETIQESSVLGYIDSFVNGVDYVTISVPSFPISQNDDEITQEGAMTITQIP